MMNIVSWNVNGLRAVVRKELFHPFVAASEPDVICLQETRLQPHQVSLDLPSHPYHYWSSAERKGYSGTGIVSNREPLAVQHGLGVARHDGEGRVLAAEFDDFFVVSVYVPNAKRDLSRLDERQDWDRSLRDYLKTLAQHKPVVCGGDFNVAHTVIDLARPKQNAGQHGFTPEERSGFQRLLEAGFIDVFRHLHADEPHHYTWWRQFGGARERNVGWRLDYIIMSEALLPRLEAACILPQVYGSDHCPVAVRLGAERQC